MTTDINIKNALDDFNPSFKPGFESRVMEGLVKARDITYTSLFSRAFKRIALSGAAAIIILLISIYISDGSLSADTLLGTSEIDIESYTAMTFSNY